MTIQRTRPLQAHTSTRLSLVIYLALMVYLVVVRILIELGWVQVPIPPQAMLFGWPMIAFLTLVGGCAVWLGPRTGLPAMWDPNIPPRSWLPLVAVAGLGLGAVNLAFHWFTGSARMLAEAANVSTINAPFPGSIAFYSGGAIVVESLFRLILLTLPLLLIGNVLLHKRHQKAVFWGVALLASLLEAQGQMDLTATGNVEVMLAVGAAMYALNLFEAHLFWRFGLLAPLVFRLGFYLVWHVMGGLLGI
jgi:hypothetical protein